MEPRYRFAQQARRNFCPEDCCPDARTAFFRRAQTPMARPEKKAVSVGCRFQPASTGAIVRARLVPRVRLPGVSPRLDCPALETTPGLRGSGLLLIATVTVIFFLKVSFRVAIEAADFFHKVKVSFRFTYRLE